MAGHDSYTALENALRHRFRDDLNHAESLQDVRAAFGLAVRKLLAGVLGEHVRFYDDDVGLLPGKTPAWQLSAAITGLPAFCKAMGDSDLAAILDRLAEAATHRYQSLSEHEDRIRARIHKDH